MFPVDLLRRRRKPLIKSREHFVNQNDSAEPEWCEGTVENSESKRLDAQLTFLLAEAPKETLIEIRTHCTGLRHSSFVQELELPSL